MCWYINKDKFEENPMKYHHIADEDIIVFKIGYIGKNHFASLFNKHYHSFLIGKLEEEIRMKPFFPSRDVSVIKKGYHSYSEDCFICIDSDCFRLFRKKDSTGEYLACYNIDSERFGIGRFVIPHGTEYYSDNKGTIVSSNIAWTGESVRVEDIENDKFIKLKDIELCVGK